MRHWTYTRIRTSALKSLRWLRTITPKDMVSLRSRLVFGPTFDVATEIHRLRMELATLRANRPMLWRQEIRNLRIQELERLNRVSIDEAREARRKAQMAAMWTKEEDIPNAV